MQTFTLFENIKEIKQTLKIQDKQQGIKDTKLSINYRDND